MTEHPGGATPLDHLIDWYHALEPASLADIASYYAPQARFRDPFNDVVGCRAIRRVFEHMFENTDAPRFTIESRVFDGTNAFVTWTFRCRAAGRSFEIDGASRFQFDADGRVSTHRDYWDAAEGWYGRLPLLGLLLGMLRRRFSASR